MKDIYITGAQALTPPGFGTHHLLSPSISQKRIPKLSPRDYGWKKLNRLSEGGKAVCMTIGDAVEASGVSWPFQVDAERTGLLVATTHTNLEAIVKLYEEAEKYGAKNVNPGIFPETVLNSIGGHAAIYFNIEGTNATISNEKTSGLKALIYASDLLNTGQLDRVIVTGVHLFPPEIFTDALKGSYLENESVVSIVLEKSKIKYSKSWIKFSIEIQDSSSDHLPACDPAEALIKTTASYSSLNRNSTEHSACFTVNPEKESRYKIQLGKV